MDQRRRVERETPASRLAEAEREIWTPASGIAPLGYHLTARLTDDRVLAPTAAARRELASIIYDQGEERGLVAFGAADNHLHIAAACDRATASELARYTLMSLRWRLQLSAAFEPCRIRPIVDQRHLGNTAGYAFRQEARHGVECDPFHDASSLVDLLGLRRLGPKTSARFRSLLPRLSPHVLAATAGIPAPKSAVIKPELLAEAALSAAGLPRFAHNNPSLQARCAAAHLLAAPADQVGALLGVTDRTIRRLRTMRPDAALLEAIKGQLLMRSAALLPAGGE